MCVQRERERERESEREGDNDAFSSKYFNIKKKITFIAEISHIPDTVLIVSFGICHFSENFLKKLSR